MNGTRPKLHLVEPRPYDPTDCFAGLGEEPATPVEATMKGATWSWPSFAAGLVCGLIAGILAIAVPATVLVEFVL